MSNNNNNIEIINKLKKEFIKLYLILRISKEENKNNENEIKKNLEKKDILTLFNYIKSSLDVIVEILVEEKLTEFKTKNENTQEDYESLLIKYENDIRGHIRIEQQLKIFCENLQDENEILEKKIQSLKKKNKDNNNFTNSINFTSDTINVTSSNYNETNNNNNNEIIKELKDEIKNTNIILKSYENQVLKLSENEKKLKNIIKEKDKN